MVDVEAERFQGWFGAVPIEEFRTRYPRSAPLIHATRARGARSLFDWDDLGLLLADEPEVVVVARGQAIRMPPPRSLVQLRWHFAAGVGLCVRRAEQHCAKLARVATWFGDLGPAHIQVFATPGGSYRVGWHYDDEGIFIAQMAGTEVYSYCANTVTADQAARPESFRRFSDEISPLATATLGEGDFLYIPARWWHMASCRADALSLAIGVASPDLVFPSRPLTGV